MGYKNDNPNFKVSIIDENQWILMQKEEKKQSIQTDTTNISIKTTKRKIDEKKEFKLNDNSNNVNNLLGSIEQKSELPGVEVKPIYSSLFFF